jgi:probable H4MPT-linked C1 transfer pathway protein
MSVHWLALDIGGANLKAANGEGYAAARPFPLWSKPEQLAYELRAMIAEGPETDHLAVTMTGELADCFASKAEGVRFILDAVEQASDRRHTRVDLINGKLVAPVVARREPILAAASNWRALAEFSLRFAGQESSLLIDVGSTTTDIIPLVNGRVAASGTTDTQRLLSGELVYAGVARRRRVPDRTRVFRDDVRRLFAARLRCGGRRRHKHGGSPPSHQGRGASATGAYDLRRRR